MNCNKLIAFALGIAVGAAAQAKGAVIVASDSGFYFSSGYHSAANYNYDSDMTTHDFFVFDLTGVSGTVTSASLELFNPPSGYSGPSGGLQFDVYDVSTSVSSLEQSYASNDATGVNIYGDLGSGTVFGSQTVSQADDNNYVTVNLDSSALAAINAARGGELAFGGALAATNNTQFIFGFSNTPDYDKLVIETSSASVPEPSSIALFGMACAAVLGSSRWRTAAAALALERRTARR